MQRERLTITLKNDILKLVDKFIDGERIRNRSHAIEYLLAKTLVPPQVKVLILAGGRGVSFRPLTYELPKAMIPIKGRPLLEHTLLKLKQFNLTDVTISLGHLGEKIRNYFDDGSRLGLKISYLQQSGKGGTAKPLKQAEGHFKEPFLLIYGDVLADINYLDLLDFHRSQQGQVATMALASVEKVSAWGVAKLIGNKIIAFEEKPKKIQTRSHLINAGIYMLNPSIFKYISPTTDRLEKEVFPRLAEEGKLIGYPFEGSWHDVSTPKVYEEVLNTWR
ncbi:MAG: nucleotidyltransferase family protein [Candidatus Doudnabacteria bacterium]|nr:nucleotidyltransferase family protein [Candidatus Doudnabacteria bacterium]